MKAQKKPAQQNKELHWYVPSNGIYAATHKCQ
jgi:hypothetical protein